MTRRPLRFGRRRSEADQIATLLCDTMLLVATLALLGWCMFVVWTGPQ